MDTQRQFVGQCTLPRKGYETFTFFQNWVICQFHFNKTVGFFLRLYNPFFLLDSQEEIYNRDYKYSPPLTFTNRCSIA